MSTTIDQRVVEMRFDNRHFEENVRTSMSTLDKLKEKLHLKGATTGIENINSAVRKVDVSSLGSSVEKVGLKFNGLYTMADQALRNLENRIEQTAQKMVSALTIDPIKTGFSEYETQINAIQTILANTQSKGSTLDDVNTALDTLNEYADQTIYNFTEMTNNIGRFTAAGVDLQTSVDSIKGIANLAAVSGSTSQQASTAMYQLSQALAAGKVSLMDWNSVVNAGMGGELFQNALIRTSELLKTGAKDAINTYGSFRESLTKGEWLTTEVLTETLKQLSGAYTEADLVAQGFTKEQAKEITELAETAKGAATDVKTFTQLWDTLKETAQSGWTQTWELIVGDFESAKEMLSGLSDFLGGVINGWSDSRNTLLGGALNMSSPWESITEKLDKAGLGNIKKVAKAVGEVTDNLTKFQKIVDQVWLGDFGNSDTGRFEKLEAAGYDHRVVQDLVNKGNDYKLTIEDIEESHKKFGLTMDKTSESTKKTADSIGKLSDEQLKNAGLTDAEIRLYRDLEEEAKRTGKSVSELADEMSKADGRTMILDGLKNVGKQLVKVFGAIKDAWSEIFPPMSVVTLYSVIKRFSDFTKGLEVTDDTAEKLKRTFKGVFAIIDIIATIAGGALRTAFKMVSTVMDYFNVDILDVTAAFGDWIVKIRDWIDEHNLLTKGLEIMLPYLKDAAEGIKKWFDSLKDSDNLPRDIIQGLINGLKEGVSRVWDAICEIATGIIDTFKEILGIHSPSTEFFEMGINIIQGLTLGLAKGMPAVIKTLKKIGQWIIDSLSNVFSWLVSVIKDIDVGDIIAVGLFAGYAIFAKNLYNVLSMLAKPLQGLTHMFTGVGDMFEDLGDMFEGIGKNFKAAAFKKKTQGILNIAAALAVLAGALLIISKIDPDRLWSSVGVFVILSLCLTGLAFAISKMGSLDVTVFTAFSKGMLAIGAAILLIAFAMEKIGDMSVAEFAKASIALLGISLMMGSLMLLSKFTGNAKRLDGIGKMFLKLSFAMLILVGVGKIIAGMTWEDMGKAAVGLLGLGVIISILIGITKFSGNSIDGLGKTIFKISIAMLMLIGVGKIIAGMTWEDMGKALIGLGGLIGLITTLILISNFAGRNIDKVGGTIFKISIAMLLLTGVIAILGTMDPDQLVKGIIATGFLALIVEGLMIATRFAGTNVNKMALTLIAMSVAIGILAGVAILLSYIDLKGLAKGIIVVGLLSIFLSGMIKATKRVGNCAANLIVLSVAIGLMALAVGLLSKIEPKGLFSATIAMSILMGMFALIAKASGSATGSLATLIVMTVAIGLMVGLILLLSLLPIEKALSSAGSLGILMLSLAGSMKLIGSAGTVSWKAIGVITLMTVIMGALGGILWLLQDLPVDKTIATAGSLSGMVLVLSASVLILSKIGSGAGAALAGIGVMMVLIAAITGVIAGIGALSKIEGFNELIRDGGETLGLIGYAIGNFVGSIVGGLAAGITSGLPEIGANLSAFIENVGPFIEGCKQVDGSVLEGVGILAGAILALTVADFLSGIVQFLSFGESFADLGTDLSLFMTNALPFVIGARLIKPDMLEGVGALVEAIVLLSAANFLDGLASLFSGGQSIAEFGEALPELGNCINGFATNLGTFDEDKVSTIKCAADAIKAIASAADSIPNEGGWLSKLVGDNSISTFGSYLPVLGTYMSRFATNLGTFDEDKVSTIGCAADAIKKIATAAGEIPNEGGWLSKLVGDNSIATFGSYLPTLGTYVSNFATNLGTFDEDKVATVECAAKAISLMASAASEIPNEGGWISKLVGDNSVSTFGSYLPWLGTCMANFARNLGTFDEDKVSTVECAAKAISLLATAAQDIPNEGGWISKIVGDNSIATFGGYLAGLGTNMNEFATNLGTFDEDKVATVECAASAIAAMAKAAESIPNEGGWISKLVGDNSIATFGGYLPGLGTNLSGFADNLGTFNEDKVATVKCATKAVSAIAELSKVDIKSAAKHMGDFGESMVEFGNDVYDFCTNMSQSTGADISLAVGKVKKLTTMLTELSSIDTSAAAKFKNAIKSLGETGVSEFIDAFTNANTVSDLKIAGEDTVGHVMDGAEDMSDDLVGAFEDMVDEATSAVSTEGRYNAFKSAGSYLVTGFANGISENSYTAEAKARAMAIAAKEAAEEALGIQSPSKVFYQIGGYTGQGFVNALDDFASKSYSAGAGMADNARKGLTNAIGRIKNVIDSDMDTQPTIRPVLDLSNVEAGTNKLNNMLNLGSSTRVLADVGTINSMMNGYNQNGGNADVVSAIDRLRKDLGNIGGDQYNLGDITYDDGSNISNAIKSIVKAARIERRV